jgi:hypothetical protein
MKQILALTSLFFLFTSCYMDKIDISQIKNNSNQTIQINISFDKSYLDSIYPNANYKHIVFLNGLGHDSGVKMQNFDSLRLLVSYKVLPNATFTLASGLWGPSYPIYNSITIKGRDTIVLGNKNEIYHAFKNIDGKFVFNFD